MEFSLLFSSYRKKTGERPVSFFEWAGSMQYTVPACRISNKDGKMFAVIGADFGANKKPPTETISASG